MWKPLLTFLHHLFVENNVGAERFDWWLLWLIILFAFLEGIVSIWCHHVFQYSLTVNNLRDCETLSIRNWDDLEPYDLIEKCYSSKWSNCCGNMTVHVFGLTNRINCCLQIFASSYIIKHKSEHSYDQINSIYVLWLLAVSHNIQMVRINVCKHNTCMYILHYEKIFQSAVYTHTQQPRNLWNKLLNFKIELHAMFNTPAFCILVKQCLVGRNDPSYLPKRSSP